MRPPLRDSRTRNGSFSRGIEEGGVNIGEDRGGIGDDGGMAGEDGVDAGGEEVILDPEL